MNENNIDAIVWIVVHKLIDDLEHISDIQEYYRLNHPGSDLQDLYSDLLRDTKSFLRKRGISIEPDTPRNGGDCEKDD